MKALAACTAWMLGGLTVTGGLFWAFLNTPESTVWTLAASALLLLAMYFAIGLTWSGALMGWSRGWSRPALGRALRGTAAFLPPLLLAGAAWWIIGRALAWMGAHAGEIGAWLMVQFGWADSSPLLAAVGYALNWLRMVAVPFAALVWLGVLLDRGWRPMLDRASIRRAFAPKGLLIATVVFVATIVLPLSYGTYWMPRSLPVSWVEPAVAAIKFGVMGVVAAAGLSVIAGVAAPRR